MTGRRPVNPTSPVCVNPMDPASAGRVGQAVFAGRAAAGSDAFTGLQAGIVVLALVMAVGSAWGLSRRLAEYR